MADITERLRDRGLVLQQPERDRIADEINRLRVVVRVNGLRAGFSHDEIDRVLYDQQSQQEKP